MLYAKIHQDKHGRARLGKLVTAHGGIDTPCFMPVGTHATVKGILPHQLDECGAQIMLANAYHVFLRPGIDVIRKAGGLHNFMSWERPILTDSGGYQIFSLARLRKVTDDGVEFQSHIDGKKHFLNPENVMDIQVALGADIIMPLDECAHYPCSRDHALAAMNRTVVWARRSVKRFTAFQQEFLDSVRDGSRDGGPAGSGGVSLKEERNRSVCGPEFTERKQFLFGIIQGATYDDLRKECTKIMLDMDFEGYAVGGVSVGEPSNLIYNAIDQVCAGLPHEKPRYVMGVGLPQDIIEAVDRGVDMFDCVVPTRYGRNGTAFTSLGKIVIRNSPYIEDFTALDPNCSCFVCKEFSRAYIRHLFNAEEMLGLMLVSYHNIYFFLDMMRKIRAAIAQDSFSEFKKDFLAKYNNSTGGR